ncbi:MAG: 9-O-acetylesterase, partial [Planctomycetes bacterium]|nr:9-O-acetylesterase [Planctomycetota bacterium]
MPHRLGRHAFALSLVFLALAPAGAQSPLWLPRVFADHMVVQRDAPVPVWGRDKPGAQVTVTLGKVGANAVADKRGTWRATLPATPAGGPFDLTVKGSDTRVFHDVLVGEVWLCSGQSNMEMGVGLVRRAKEEIAAANHPRIRLCSIPRTVAGEPESDVPASWRVCSPQTLGKDGWGGFSAAGYFFGRELLQKLDVPIGLIDSTWGGTRIEPWTPPQGFAKVESLRKVGEEVARKHHGYKTGLPARLLAVEGWIEATRKALADGSNLPPAPTLPRHPTRDARAPTGLFNGMIHPLAPFAIRGAIWYQG